MTLIAVAAGPRAVVVATDRQTSYLRSGKFVPAETEHSKMACLSFRDARLAMAFTGLASVGGVLTRRKLLEIFGEAAPPDFLAYNSLVRSVPLIQAWVDGLSSLTPDQRRLTVLATGYQHSDGPPIVARAVISNFEVSNGEVLTSPLPTPVEFQIEASIFEDSSAASYAALFGNTRPLVEGGLSDFDELTEMLEGGKPPYALAGKAIDLIQTIHNRYPHAGIGGQCTAVTIPPDLAAGVAAVQATQGPQRELFGLAQADFRGEGPVLLLDEFTLRAEGGSNGPEYLRIPKVGRNQPCPCGSDKKFKKCHGGRAASRSPSFEFGWGPPPFGDGPAPGSPPAG